MTALKVITSNPIPLYCPSQFTQEIGSQRLDHYENQHELDYSSLEGTLRLRD